MNIEKLRQAEADFLARYPGGFADPGLAPIRKKHNVERLSEFARANLTRTHFNRPEQVCETLVRIVSRSSMVSVFEKATVQGLRPFPEYPGERATGVCFRKTPVWACQTGRLRRDIGHAIPL